MLSSAGTHRTLPLRWSGEGSPTRTMTWYSALLALLDRAVEVSSSSMDDQDGPSLWLKNAPRLNPPLPSWAPTWLSSTTFLSCSGQLPKTARKPSLARSKAASEACCGSGQTTAAVQSFRASSRSSNFILETSSKSKITGCWFSDASFFSRSTSSCSVSPQPQTATRPSTPRDSAPLPAVTSEFKPGLAVSKRLLIFSKVAASSSSAFFIISSSATSSKASNSASSAANCAAASSSSACRRTLGRLCAQLEAATAKAAKQRSGLAASGRI
mmetsp:Transcript_116669/g.277338  ORF Transcript_116669/g.277338 Transcript_116669/m.277338 type:complete len:270 (+) Transcript_116669:607-1416(+)